MVGETFGALGLLRRCEPGLLRVARGLIALVLVAIATPAHAGNRLNYFQGSQAAMTGAAVTAIGHDAGAFWYNPAGLGANDRDRLDLSGTAFSLGLRQIPDALVLKTPDGTTRRDLEGSDFGIVAPALVFVRRLERDMSLAFGIVISQQRARALSADIGYGGIRQFERGTSEDGGDNTNMDGSAAAMRLRFVEQIQRQHIGAAWGWQLTPRLRVGASAFFVNQTELEQTQMGVTYLSRTEGQRLDFYANESFVDEQAHRGIEASLGLQWQPIERLHIGMSLRTPAWRVGGKGQAEWASVMGYQRGEVIGSTSGVLDLDRSNDDEDVERQLTPMRTTLGLAWQGDGWWISAEADYEFGYRTSVRDTRFADVDFDYDPATDTWTETVSGAPKVSVDVLRPMLNARIGGQYRFTDTVEIGAGLYTDRSPQPIQRGFPETDIDYYGGTLGVTLTTPVRLAREEHAPTIMFATTLAARYAYGRGVGYQLEQDFSDPESVEYGGDWRENAVLVEAHDVSVFLGSTLTF